MHLFEVLFLIILKVYNVLTNPAGNGVLATEKIPSRGRRFRTAKGKNKNKIKYKI